MSGAPAGGEGGRSAQERGHPATPPSSRVMSHDNCHLHLLTMALRRDIACIERGHGVARDVRVRLWPAALGAALQEVLNLGVEALLPFLVGGGMAPPLLGAELLDEIDIAELRGFRVVRDEHAVRARRRS